MKYIIQVYEGEINGHGEKEGLPTEYQYEFEQEMLKHVHDLKKEIRENGWFQRDTPEISQTSFLRSEDSDAELGFKFEWGWYNLIHSFVHNLSQFGGSITYNRWSRKELN